MGRILVTGGAGFIGSHVMERLIREGNEVVCLDNFDPFYDRGAKVRNLGHVRQAGDFTLIEGDIRDRDLLEGVFSQHRIEKIFHAAARAGVRPSIEEPSVYEAVNVAGTLNLLQCAVRHRVGRFVFASSSSVYGEGAVVPFTEDCPTDRPLSPYAATKKAGELLCYTFHRLYGLPVVCLRFFTVYGPRQRPDMAIRKFTQLIWSGEAVPVYGDGSARRDYTYIDDAVDGVLAALNRPLGFDVINIGESRTVSLLELISLLEEQLGQKAAIRHLPLQPGDVPETWADLTRARQRLGYHPKTDIVPGLKRFVAWFNSGGMA